MRKHNVLTVGFNAVESAAANYAAVVAGATEGNVDLPAAAGAAAFGLLQPKQNAASYSADDQCDVMLFGVSPYNKASGSTVSAGDRLIVGDTSGNLKTYESTDGSAYIVGVALDDLASADLYGYCLVGHTQVIEERTLVETETGETEDATLTIDVPIGYQLEAIYLTETAGNAVTGGIDIGTTSSGEEVVSQEAVTGSAELVDCTLVKRFFSETAATTLYISAHTSWNSASVNLRVVMTKVI